MSTTPLVLVVDDLEDLRVVLSDLLTVYGFRTVTAGSGSEALSIFATRRPDVAVVDLRMPDMDGFELAAKLRASQLDLPIFAYTGWSGEAVERRAREVGCSGVLLKTVDPKVIVASLRAAVQPRAI